MAGQAVWDSRQLTATGVACGYTFEQLPPPHLHNLQAVLARALYDDGKQVARRRLLARNL
jgi:hypothetical protein